MDPSTYAKAMELLDAARTHARLASIETRNDEQEKYRARERACRLKALRLLSSE